MSNTIRIRTTPNGGDKYLKVKLDQDFDFIEILSLKISQEDTYRKFCSDYGVVVGRVIINNGFGVPNAKVSVFIPLDDIDKNDPLIKGLYPYEVLTDKNSDGVRYNLLPKDGDSTNECSTPIGTFPSKREILDNPTLLDVYCKYYKFTTTTNHAGDFMIFGVPVGTYTIHVDADISDIGIASQRPYDLIGQGTPVKFFNSPTKFNGGKNLDKLIQVKTLNAGVNVQPFWGDTENCEIGISRVDFDLNYTLRPAAIFMGSIYGDQHKHSINKRCRPRKKLGEMCDQVTGPGSVDMIRKTIDGQIEEFSVDGGRVIDDDGTWAFQVPMNLDYMVTDEEGNLILSQDPNAGIPTRASVRFSIGMDETGGEGRLRTRAKYLVPNNPSTPSEIDYEFGANTKNTSFRDLYWNKIYSVSNFISRFQKQSALFTVKTRAMTAMKDVDACAGDKTPFPYNKVNTEVNPIFFIICLVIKIVSFLIFVMNSLLIPLINVMIKIINKVIGAICTVINTIIDVINSAADILGADNIDSITCDTIPPIPCITVKCPEDDSSVFAPGCKNGGLDSGDGFNSAAAHGNPPNYYDGDPSGHSGIIDFSAGLDNCIAFEMAKALNLFQFDFYNDWVNGSLFGFLLKYKKKRKKREIFCEYDCADFGISSGGVDGNGNGVSDNNCHNNILLDTCYNGAGHNNVPSPNIHGTNPTGFYQNSQLEYKDSNTIREGLIKKVGGDLYYAATTHDTRFKLFATDIISLGSVFECDWQGIPKIQDLLIPTTYKLPPDIQELSDNGVDIEACGMVDIGGSSGYEFFEIDCLGLHTDYKGCLNIRHICEMGVDIDEAQEDPLTGNILVQADCIIGINDIDEDRGQWFRDVFTGLNSSSTTPTSLNISGLNTNFNLLNQPIYNFAASGASDNGNDYASFRGYSNDNNFDQSKHSYFFYFGILPGKTALDKMNQRYFTHCNAITRDDIIIQSTTTVASGSTGTLTFTFIGGTGPYTYTVTGVAPLSYSNSGTGTTVTLTGLDAGTYLITGVDSLGTPVTQTVTVSGPAPLYCSVYVNKNATTASSNDGEITISSVGGGSGTYTYELKSFGGTVYIPAGTPISLSANGGLPIDNIHGYIVTISDGSSTCVTSGLTVTGPNPIILSASTKTDVLCYGNFTGVINLFVTGGQSPFSFNTTGPAGYTSGSPNMSGLQAGTYVTTVIDSLSASTSISTVLTQPGPMTMVSASISELQKQCDPSQYIIPFYVTAGASAGPINVEYDLDNTSYVGISLTYVNSSTPLILNIPSSQLTSNIKIRFRNVAGTCTSNALLIFKSAIQLPVNQLSCSISTTGPDGSGNYTHVISAVGGIGPVTGTGTIIDTNPTITATVTDDVGCSSTSIG